MIVKISMTTCKTSRINEVWLNATTEAVLWSRGHPAKTATITTTVDESIAEPLCLVDETEKITHQINGTCCNN